MERNKNDAAHQALVRSLQALAMDLHWSWNHATDKIWRQLDPLLWELTYNPLVVLQTVSQDRLQEVLSDPLVQDTINELSEEKRQRALAPAWFRNTHPAASLSGVAFFCMEYMLSEALPIYSGGLGNVAGDLLKTASDLGVPLTGIGLLYQQSYTRQVIFKDGTQQYVFPYNDPGQLPITPLRHPNGEWLRIEIPLPGHSLWLRTWKVQVGNVQLLLLDSNDAANCAVHRGITAELYGSDAEFRLLQEMILGIGGWKLLKALNRNPEVCHLNEGHAAFAILERARSFMEENGQPFDVALQVTRAGNMFTTHTAVGAGFDLFAPDLMERYLGAYVREKLNVSFADFLSLGRKNATDETEKFNTSYLAIRGSAFINGVSRLHAQVSRQLYAPLFPGWPVEEVPIGSVTNGVHMPTWDSNEADRLWTESCGKERWLGTLQDLEKEITSVSDERLWLFRTRKSQSFIKEIRRHYSRQLASIGSSREEIEEAGRVLDPEFLTMGFARRFVAYKRPDLLLKNPERLRNILANSARPVQLVLAGKPHPRDEMCRDMIRSWIRFTDDYGLRNRIVFLSDYDMHLTGHMVQGVDLWINTPRRPWEACGTSGMKVLVNGGLNLSERDGWWDEAYDPERGWTFGDRELHEDDPAWDAAEAEQLYRLLETEVVPAFYERNRDGIPEAWVRRMRNSMARLTPDFSSSRCLQEYTAGYYLPAAQLYRQRAAEKGRAGKLLTEWTTEFKSKWRQVHFGNMDVQTNAGQYRFTVPLFLNGLPVNDVSVELYATGENGHSPVHEKMVSLPNGLTVPDVLYFTATAPADRPSQYYTPRVVPAKSGVAVPLECSGIHWQH